MTDKKSSSKLIFKNKGTDIYIENDGVIKMKEIVMNIWGIKTADCFQSVSLFFNLRNSLTKYQANYF